MLYGIQNQKQTQDIVELVTPISNLVSDPTDRAKLAIFNQAFATRVKGYDTDLQQVNDVYVLAGSHFFESTLVDKNMQPLWWDENIAKADKY